MSCYWQLLPHVQNAEECVWWPTCSKTWLIPCGAKIYLDTQENQSSQNGTYSTIQIDFSQQIRPWSERGHSRRHRKRISNKTLMILLDICHSRNQSINYIPSEMSWNYTCPIYFDNTIWDDEWTGSTMLFVFGPWNNFITTTFCHKGSVSITY